jgi:hypothetical protein
MVKVDSSVIDTVGYDMDRSKLFIRFVSGELYVYYNVSFLEYIKLINAISVGKYFNHNIKDCYSFDKVREE